jgi:hypothetical protein
LEKFKDELILKGRSIIGVEVTVEDLNHITTLTAVVEWYVQKVA